MQIFKRDTCQNISVSRSSSCDTGTAQARCEGVMKSAFVERTFASKNWPIISILFVRLRFVALTSNHWPKRPGFSWVFSSCVNGIGCIAWFCSTYHSFSLPGFCCCDERFVKRTLLPLPLTGLRDDCWMYCEFIIRSFRWVPFSFLI